ncbi:lysophospholipid acyltransferase family protein [uncultured Sphingomonas sp.]|uniref:lysophospholipid acyltransferase family protein n=1 Tax=uncultured Sphingomonas sp. TaxID=158754 RepID=UPI0035CB2B94
MSAAKSSYPRIAARLAGLAGLLVGCVVLHGGWRLLRPSSPWPRRFLAGAAWTCGVRTRVRGHRPSGSALIVSNHCGTLDILVLGGATGAAFVAKGELARVPIVGAMCRANGTLFVDRTDRRAIHEQVARLREALAHGPVVVFPEGTTSDGATLLPFKPALLAALDPPPPGVVLQPVFLDYGSAAPEIAWAEAAGENGLTNALRILGRRGTIPVVIDYLEPFDPAKVGDRKAVAAEARRRITAAMAAAGSRIRVA